MLKREAIMNLSLDEATNTFNDIKENYPKAVIQMLEQADGRWTVTFVWDPTGDPVDSASEATVLETTDIPPHDGPRLGILSERFESNNNPAAIGYDKKGGFSYGTYQLASAQGSVGKFLNFLQTQNTKLFNKLNQAGGAAAAQQGTEEFRQAWRESAKSPDFSKLQHTYIQSTYYEPFVKKILTTLDLDIKNHSLALQNVAWSVAVQHGVNNDIFTKVLNRDTVNEMSDADIIRKVYAERPQRFTNSTARVQASVAARFVKEEQQALTMLA